MHRYIPFLFLVPLLFNGGCTTQSGLSSVGQQGGGLAGVSSLVRSITGASNASQMGHMETQTVINSLNQLKQELPFVQSFEQGRHIYQILGNVITQLTGQSAYVELTNQYPSVDIVRQQIADIEDFLNEQTQMFNNMSTQQLQKYVQKLEMVNTTITQASVFRGGSMMPGMGMMGGGMMGAGASRQGTEDSLGMMGGMLAGRALARRL